jgi:putative nucleotidyltransferase with HDIG domain
VRLAEPSLDGDLAVRFRAAVSLARSVDSRDAYTGSHSERVSTLAASVAAQLGLADDTVELVRIAAAVHDLGKLAIPEEILRKPGGLSSAERLVIERHPQIGHRMLSSLGADPIADWVLHHHEWWDGTGYPGRLSGHEIPIGSRIILVVDAYDAMTSTHLFRTPMGHAAALHELERGAGTQFDPEVVEAFVAAVGAGYAAAV